MQSCITSSVALEYGARVHTATRALDALSADDDRASSRAESEHALLKTLMDHLPVPVYAKDTAGRYIMVNAAAAKLMGAVSVDEAIGRTDFDFYRTEIAAAFRADEERILETGRPIVNKDEPNVDHEGRLRWILTTKVPLRDEKGRLTGIVGIGKDITERKKLERERDQYVERLQGALENRRRMQGLTTICSSCKKIEDDAGAWHEIEAFMSQYTEMEFTHSMCPECRQSLYGSTRDLEAALALASE